jgi:hypothetical protein
MLSKYHIMSEIYISKNKVSLSENFLRIFSEKDTEWKVKVNCSPFTTALTAPLNGELIYDPFVVTKERPPTYMVTLNNISELRVILYRMNILTDLKKWGTESHFSDKSDTGTHS